MNPHIVLFLIGSLIMTIEIVTLKNSGNFCQWGDFQGYKNMPSIPSAVGIDLF